SSFGVNRADVMTPVIIGKDAFGARIVIDSVWSLAYINLINQLQRGRIKHRDFVLATVAGETMFELRRDSNTVHAGRVGNGPNQFTVIGVHNVDLCAMRKIKSASSAIDGYVVKPAIAGNRIASLEFVSCTALKYRQGNGHCD